MNKFIYKKDQNYTDHWEFCNQNKYPFITINNIDNGFSELFFDITNISNKLEDISNSIKEISSCYNNFWELYTSLHHQQHIVFMRISKKATSKRKSSFNNV